MERVDAGVRNGAKSPIVQVGEQKDERNRAREKGMSVRVQQRGDQRVASAFAKWVVEESVQRNRADATSEDALGAVKQSKMKQVEGGRHARREYEQRGRGMGEPECTSPLEGASLRWSVMLTEVRKCGERIWVMQGMQT